MAGTRAARQSTCCIRCGRTIHAIGLEGWRVDVDYPEDREHAKALLGEMAAGMEG